jgi:hypothetical protein
MKHLVRLIVGKKGGGWSARFSPKRQTHGGDYAEKRINWCNCLMELIARTLLPFCVEAPAALVIKIQFSGWRKRKSTNTTGGKKRAGFCFFSICVRKFLSAKAIKREYSSRISAHCHASLHSNKAA